MVGKAAKMWRWGLRTVSREADRANARGSGGRGGLMVCTVGSCHMLYM